MADKAAQVAEPLDEFDVGPFYWGAATSSHQVEGGNKNDWTEWEYANSARLAAQAARRHANAHTRIPDHIIRRYPNPLQEENYISGAACDHYNRFREDFDLAKQLGHNAHRFSLEWSRIEPEEGRFNESALAHYREVIAALRERGLEPFVTLWHWTLPLWLAKRDGVLNKKFPEYFARFVRRVVDEYKSEVRFWITLNEPQIITSYGYFKDIWPPQKNSVIAGIRAMRQLVKAHRLAYATLHAGSRNAQVGIATSNSFLEPASDSLLDRAVVALNQYLRNRAFLNQIRNFQDFVGVNYYSHDRVSFAFRLKSHGGAFVQNKNKNERVDDRGHELYPFGIYHVLKDAARYNVPLYITENGLADARDIYRAAFIEETLRWVARARHEGVDVRGYFHWSLLDNFEWDKGFWPRFGLVEIDYRTLERKPRPSAWRYKELIEAAEL